MGPDINVNAIVTHIISPPLDVPQQNSHPNDPKDTPPYPIPDTSDTLTFCVHALMNQSFFCVCCQPVYLFSVPRIAEFRPILGVLKAYIFLTFLLTTVQDRTKTGPSSIIRL